jgi:hypothetical protein
MIFLALLFMGFTANATDLIITNHTGADIRVTQLRNKCQDFIITEDKQRIVKNNEGLLVKDIVPVVQTYTICGSGFCSSSAMGMKKSKEYVLEVTLDKDGMITGDGKPDDWVGNLECPNEKK